MKGGGQKIEVNGQVHHKIFVACTGSKSFEKYTDTGIGVIRGHLIGVFTVRRYNIRIVLLSVFE